MKNPDPPHISDLLHLPAARRWRSQERPVTSLVAILRSAPSDPIYPPNAYLLIQRIKPPYKDKWAMVGGKWDFGESLEEAVSREVFEETGLKTAFRSLRGIMNERILPLDDSIAAGHYILFVCELQVTDGIASEKYEGPVAWFQFEQMQHKADEGEMIATDFALLETFRSCSEKLVFIEAEVWSSMEQDKRVDRIQRFEVTGTGPDTSHTGTSLA